MQEQEPENNPEVAKSALPAQKATEPSEQKQQQKQPNLIQRILIAIPLTLQLVRGVSRATRQDPIALQVEDAFIKSLEQLNVSAELVQTLKERFAKTRQRTDHARLEDIYIMGGVLIYCGILFPVLINLGIPDFPTQLAWIAFAISFPSTAGFFLVRFLKEKNNISSHGWIHGILAFLAEIGAITMTVSLCFHIWNVVGWVCLLWTLVILFGYQRYRWSIYYKPFLSIFKTILKNLNDAPPVSV